MKQIKTRSLSQTDNEEILYCFNTAFSDYSIPFQLSREQLEIKLRTESVDKSISVGAFNENELIGFVLHGGRLIDGDSIAYNAGTGVVPKERGAGITQKMYEFIKPILKQDGFKEVFLEVISNNFPAISSYKKTGFKEIRQLSCFKGEPQILETNRSISIMEVPVIDFDGFPLFGEVRPTWQNSEETILNMGSSARYVLAYAGDEVCGYCILNQDNNRILQMAVKKEFRNRLVGSSLLNYIKAKISGPISIINVDNKHKSTLHFLENRNMRKTLSQIEMKLEI